VLTACWHTCIVMHSLTCGSIVNTCRAMKYLVANSRCHVLRWRRWRSLRLPAGNSVRFDTKLSSSRRGNLRPQASIVKQVSLETPEK
jgi:hypothetical protein